jgi:hypothetical protein
VIFKANPCSISNDRGTGRPSSGPYFRPDNRPSIKVLYSMELLAFALLLVVGFSLGMKFIQIIGIN